MVKRYQASSLSRRNDKKPDGFVANQAQPNNVLKAIERAVKTNLKFMKSEMMHDNVDGSYWVLRRIYDGLINRRNLHLHVVDAEDGNRMK